MECPQCKAENPDDAWNCASCRINLYWAVQHYEDLASIREGRGLPTTASSAPFLIKAHKDAMSDRSERFTFAENRVRAAARKVIERKSGRAEP